MIYITDWKKLCSLRVAVPSPRQGETEAKQLASVSPSGEGTPTDKLEITPLVSKILQYIRYRPEEITSLVTGVKFTLYTSPIERCRL